MNWTVVVLAIIIIILIYLLYSFFINKSSVISKSANLKDGGNDPITTINSGQSTRYTYGIWIYVNTWDSTREKTIFSRKDNIRLYLAANEPSLYCSITCMAKDGSSLNDQNILITDNFGISNAVSGFFGSYSFTFGVNKDNVQQSSYTMDL